VPTDLKPPSYFRTYEQLKGALTELAAKYPNLVELTDIGDSGDKTRGTADRDVLAIKLTNKAVNVGKKAGAFYIAGEHAREIANPEMMMKFATQLLTGYGTDAEATALLNTREITIVPMLNPDGHSVVEKGYDNVMGGNTMQRKSTSPPAGTDINRNYDFRWGGPGASSNPSNDTYRGASAASEPETRAVQDAVLATKPGIFIDWHSYSRLNLFPWGDTDKPAPDAAGLGALANKFSTYNHYTPEQSIKLYPTSGTSIDYVYGATKAPAFVIETGDSFLQSDKQFAESWALNSPIMTYAAKVADAPYARVKGPDTLAVTVAAGAGAAAGKLNAQVAANAKGVVRAAEWTVDPVLSSRYRHCAGGR